MSDNARYNEINFSQLIAMFKSRILTWGIAVLSAIAAATGILTSSGQEAYSFQSIRGQDILIHGKGIYRHMSAEVAPQGIAQDYVTLFVAIPALLLSFYSFRRGSVKGKIVLAGTLGYFLVTYLFYLVMAMYNELFLVYVVILSMSFFAFLHLLLSFNLKSIHHSFRETMHVKPAGVFLIINAVLITLLWLSIVVPPLLDGTIIPKETEHYTTLIVQGLDLAILLPASVVAAVLFIRRKPGGYLLAPVYLGFLSLLMTAVSAKVFAMYLNGYDVMPAIIIIPMINVASIYFWISVLKNVLDSRSS